MSMQPVERSESEQTATSLPQQPLSVGVVGWREAQGPLGRDLIKTPGSPHYKLCVVRLGTAEIPKDMRAPYLWQKSRCGKPGHVYKCGIQLSAWHSVNIQGRKGISK